MGITKETILRRYEIAKQSYWQRNCIGTALYLTGLLDDDGCVDILREPIVSTAYDLKDSEEVVDGGLVTIFGGSLDSSNGKTKHIRQGIAHAGVSVNIDNEWRVLHRVGYNGEILNESLENFSSSFFGYLDLWLVRQLFGKNSPIFRMPMSSIYYHQVSLENSGENGIVSLLKKSEVKIEGGNGN